MDCLYGDGSGRTVVWPKVGLNCWFELLFEYADQGPCLPMSPGETGLPGVAEVVGVTTVNGSAWAAGTSVSSRDSLKEGK